MKYFKKVIKGIKGLSGYIGHGYPLRFNFEKKNLIDYAFSNPDLNLRSLADLGGVWKIDGAYTFYALDHYRLERAYLVDTNFSGQVKNNSSKYSGLILINDNFGREKVLNRIKSVDAVLMFDILLHQVKPDWNEILEMYSGISKVILIYNQQYTAAERTIRLLELGKERYLELLPFARKRPLYQELFNNPDEMHPGHNRPWRDIHNVWQWGITDLDLNEAMTHLGFELKYYKNDGPFSNLQHFENHAFIFVKK
jgi:hypothetical protein